MKSSHPSQSLKPNEKPPVSDGWFTIERIDDTTFSFSEYGQWMKLHSYLLVGDERAALIDTGLGIGSLRPLVSTLTHLPVTVVTTHAHWDHIGNHHEFTDIWIHEAETSWLSEGYDEEMEHIRSWLIERPFTKTPENCFRIEDFTIKPSHPTQVVRDNSQLELGGRTLQLLHTPGHSPGHLCVYDRDRGYLATGDLVYQGTLLAGLEHSDPKAFHQSLSRIENLPYLSQLLPGHGRLGIAPSLITATRQAFDQLLEQNKLQKGTGHHPFDNVVIRL